VRFSRRVAETVVTKHTARSGIAELCVSRRPRLVDAMIERDFPMLSGRAFDAPTHMHDLFSVLRRQARLAARDDTVDELVAASNKAGGPVCFHVAIVGRGSIPVNDNGRGIKQHRTAPVHPDKVPAPGDLHRIDVASAIKS